MWSLPFNAPPPNPVSHIQTSVDCSANASVGGLQQSQDFDSTFVPGIVINSEMWDYGSISDTVAISQSEEGNVASSGTSICALRGLGTSTLEIYFRVVTLSDASFGGLTYSGASTAFAQAALFFQILGADPDLGTCYNIQCHYEYYGNALTQVEGTDYASATGFTELLSFRPGSWIPFNESYNSGFPPHNSGGTISGDLVATAGRWPQPGPFGPNPFFDVFIHDTMATCGVAPTGLGNGMDEDLSGSEFVGRLTLVIGSISRPAAVVMQPANATACPLGTASFSVGPNVNPPVHQWQFESPAFSGNWFDLADGPITANASVTGAMAARLTVTGVDPGAATRYRCRVANDCGMSISNPAMLTIANAIPGDINGDGRVNGLDVQSFVGLLGSAGPQTTDFCAADLDHSGTIDGGDVQLLATRLVGP